MCSPAGDKANWRWDERYRPVRPSHVPLLPPAQAACTSFTETLGNLRSELEDLDAHLVSVQLSAESHPQKATIRPLRAGYNLPKAFAGHHPREAGNLFATSQLRMTSPNLLAHLRRETGLALVLVSHDLSAVAAVCERTAVLRDGYAITEIARWGQ